MASMGVYLEYGSCSAEIPGESVARRDSEFATAEPLSAIHSVNHSAASLAEQTRRLSELVDQFSRLSTSHRNSTPADDLSQDWTIFEFAHSIAAIAGSHRTQQRKSVREEGSAC